MCRSPPGRRLVTDEKRRQPALTVPSQGSSSPRRDVDIRMESLLCQGEVLILDTDRKSFPCMCGMSVEPTCVIPRHSVQESLFLIERFEGTHETGAAAQEPDMSCERTGEHPCRDRSVCVCDAGNVPHASRSRNCRARSSARSSECRPNRLTTLRRSRGYAEKGIAVLNEKNGDYPDVWRWGESNPRPKRRP